MGHDELTRVTLRSLAYAELCAQGVGRDRREILPQLLEAVGRSDGGALACMIDELAGQALQVQVGEPPPLRRGSVRYE